MNKIIWNQLSISWFHETFFKWEQSFVKSHIVNYSSTYLPLFLPKPILKTKSHNFPQMASQFLLSNHHVCCWKKSRFSKIWANKKKNSCVFWFAYLDRLATIFCQPKTILQYPSVKLKDNKKENIRKRPSKAIKFLYCPFIEIFSPSRISRNFQHILRTSPFKKG